MTPRHCVIYARFSPRPDADLSESLKVQTERCTAYSNAFGYSIAEITSDRELSGARADNRPGLAKALDTACRLKATLVVYSLSRLARNTRDALTIVDRLQKAGADLAILDMQIDTSSPIGRCMFTIFAAVAELERNQISQRTSDAMRVHQAAGKRMGRYPPLGKKIDEAGRLQEDTSINWDDIRQRVNEWHKKGISLRKMAQMLEGYTGRKWYHTTVKQFLNK